MNHQKRPEVTGLKVPIRDVVARERILGDEVLGGQSIINSPLSMDGEVVSGTKFQVVCASQP